jgi:7-carboxy-7-deazaguanine synthase
MMKVCEIFTSIQGESSYAGIPCTFVRLVGCNLRCVYCDTQYSYSNGFDMSVEEVIAHVKLVGVNLVEITGGEPLLQDETGLLIKNLLNDGYEVLVETNGSLRIEDLDSRAVIIMDVKTPGSCMDSKINYSNFEYIKPSDEIKFVICSREDYDWAKNFISEHRLKGRCKILFSPALGMVVPADLSRWIVEDRLDVRLNIQIHKYIFDPGERKV